MRASKYFSLFINKRWKECATWFKETSTETSGKRARIEFCTQAIFHVSALALITGKRGRRRRWFLRKQHAHRDAWELNEALCNSGALSSSGGGGGVNSGERAKKYCLHCHLLMCGWALCNPKLKCKPTILSHRSPGNDEN